MYNILNETLSMQQEKLSMQKTSHVCQTPSMQQQRMNAPKKIHAPSLCHDIDMHSSNKDLFDDKRRIDKSCQVQYFQVFDTFFGDPTYFTLYSA